MKLSDSFYLHSVRLLEGALALPPEEFERRYGVKKPAKDDCNLIFHCKSGKRSLKALKLARQMGWKW